MHAPPFVDGAIEEAKQALSTFQPPSESGRQGSDYLVHARVHEFSCLDDLSWRCQHFAADAREAAGAGLQICDPDNIVVCHRRRNIFRGGPDQCWIHLVAHNG